MVGEDANHGQENANNGQNVNTLDLFQQALKYNINISPGRIYTLQDRYYNCMRLTFAQPWSETVEKGIRKLGELVKGMK